MLRSSAESQAQLNLRFVNGTNECPQHPFGGVALVGATAVRQLANGDIHPDQVSSYIPDEEAIGSLVDITAAAHRLLGISRPTETMLNRSVPFTHALVMNGIVSTVVEFDKGQGGTVLSTIDIPDEQQRSDFRNIAANPDRLVTLRWIFSTASELLLPDALAQDPLDEYRSTLLEIGRRYQAAGADPRRMQELIHARTILSGGLAPILAYTLPENLDNHTREVLVGNLLRFTPGQALVDHHFSAPKA